MTFRDDEIEAALGTMQNALQVIARRGDCDYMHEADRPKPCPCATCTAQRALRVSAGAWRFMGARSGRTENGWNPREAAIVDAWAKYMTTAGGGPPDVRLAAILSDGEADGRYQPIPSARDWWVATTIVQWIVTNVGAGLLEAAGWKYQHYDRDRAVIDARTDAANGIARCEEPPRDGKRACGWRGPMAQLRREADGVVRCPLCGSSAIAEPRETKP